MYKFTFSILLSLISLFLSCNSNEENIIKDLNAFVNTNPQEGLIQVGSFQEKHSNFSDYTKKKLDLIRYKAEDKCYITHESDSTIKSLCEYFNKYGSDNDKMEVYYYMGSTYRDMNDNPQSIIWYDKAISIAETISLTHEDSIVLAYIYSQKADLYFRINCEKDAYLNMKKSYDMQQELNICNIVTYESMGRMAECVDSIDLTSFLYQKSAQEILQSNQTVNYSDFLGEQLAFYVNHGYQTSAEWTAGILLSITNDNTLPSNVYSALGLYFAKLRKEEEQSLYYYKIAMEHDERMEAKAGLAKKIANHYKKTGNITEATKYAFLYIDLIDSTEIQNMSRKTKGEETVQYMAELEMARLYKKNAEQEKTTNILIIISSIFIVSTLAAMLLIFKTKREKRIQKDLQKIKEQKERTEKDYQLLVKNVSVDQKLRAESAIEITSLKKRLEETGYNPKKRIDEDSWDLIFNAVDKLNPEFRSLILSYNNTLENEDLIILYLMKMGYKQADIARMTKKARSVISRKCQKIETLLGVPISDVLKKHL